MCVFTSYTGILSLSLFIDVFVCMEYDLFICLYLFYVYNSIYLLFYLIILFITYYFAFILLLYYYFDYYIFLYIPQFFFSPVDIFAISILEAILGHLFSVCMYNIFFSLC